MTSRATKLLLAAGLVALSPGIIAQSKPAPSSETRLSDQEMIGKHIFLQRCSMCHLSKYTKLANWKEPDGAPPFGPRLAGLLKDADPDVEKAVRTFILNGTQKMPGFRYALQPKEIDDLIAYIKTL